MTPYLSIIIPAYNESERIPLTLIDIDRHLAKAEFSYEILVVNDGSTDNMAAVVNKMAHAIKNLRIADFEHNRGKGAVVRDGMLMAKGEIRLFTDADNSTSIDHFYTMMPYFKKGYDIVICSRANKESRLKPPQPIYRSIPGKLGNLIIQALVLPGLWDTQCGFKAFTAHAAEEVFSRVRINRWGFDVEALSLARALGYKIKEIPVTWINDPHSHVKASAYLQVLLETITIRWWLWRDIYGIRKLRVHNSKSNA